MDVGTINQYLPLLNFLVFFLAVPAYKLFNNQQKTMSGFKVTIENQQTEITQLTSIVDLQRREISILRKVITELIPDKERALEMLHELDKIREGGEK